MDNSVRERKRGKKSGEIKIEGDIFSDTVREAQRAYRMKEWDKFKQIFAYNTENIDLLKDFNLLGNTAINMAAHSDNPKILKELLGKLSEEERWRALRKKNSHGNTLLHEIAVSCKEVEMADIVLHFEKTTPSPELLVAEEEEEMVELSEEEKKEKEEEKKRPLVEWRNLKGETPVFKAAKFGNLKMLSHLLKCTEGDMKIHEESPRETILHASVNNQSFDVALWIMMNMDKTSLVMKKNENELTCLQLLARMPLAFKSNHDDPQNFITKLVYKLLPDEGYDIEGCNSFELLRSPVRDLETGGQDARPPTPGYLLRANYAVWKYLAQVFKWIESIWKAKKKHQLAERLAEFLVRCDYSWQDSYNQQNDKVVIQLPPVLHNVAKWKEALKWKRKKKVMEDREEDENDKLLEHYNAYPPLLIAASTGIIEIIHLYLKEHPECINHVNKGGQNILHIAVKHRQEKIFEWLEDQPELLFLASQVNRKNRTVLHEVARMDYYRGSPLPGAAFQLQSELEWYERVKNVVPSHLHFHCDNDLLTAGDLLDIEHDHMLADAQKWIKETAQSCSTVAVLVATVVFAAAYTIPGSGQEMHFRTPVFIFFTIMDIVALAFSLASVVMFLSILNAPFELWDFHKSLPQKLSIGFAFLFLSLTTTMLAFSATILITIKLQWKHWTSTLVYSAALFPVTVFALIEFPLYKKIPRLFSLLNLWKKKKKTTT